MIFMQRPLPSVRASQVMLRSRGTAKPGPCNAAIAAAFELLIPVMTSG
jgi:hypothetical protein